MMPLQSSFVNWVEGSIINDDMHVTPSTITEVAQVFGVEGSL